MCLLPAFLSKRSLTKAELRLASITQEESKGDATMIGEAPEQSVINSLAMKYEMSSCYRFS